MKQNYTSVSGKQDDDYLARDNSPHLHGRSKDDQISDSVKSEDLDENLNKTTVIIQESNVSETNVIPTEILGSKQ